MVPQIGQGTVRNMYRLIFPNWMRLLILDMLPGLFTPYMDGLLIFLPPPESENGITQFEEEEKNKEGRTSNKIDDDRIISAQIRKLELGDVHRASASAL